MADPNAINLDFTETACAACDDVSTENERMIGCDGCQLWFHLRCVGLSTEDAEKKKKWYCADEKCQQAKKKKKNPTKKSGEDSDRSSVKSDAVLTLEQKLKAMEEGQKRMEQELEAEIILKRRESEIKRSLERKRMMLEKLVRDEEEEQEKQLQEEVLRERRLQLERMRARQQTFEDNMLALDNEMAKLKSSGDKHKIRRDAEVGESVSKMNHTPLRNPEVGKLTEQNMKNLKFDESDSDSEVDNEDDTGDDSGTADSESSDESRAPLTLKGGCRILPFAYFGSPLNNSRINNSLFNIFYLFRFRLHRLHTVDF